MCLSSEYLKRFSLLNDSYLTSVGRWVVDPKIIAQLLNELTGIVCAGCFNLHAEKFAGSDTLDLRIAAFQDEVSMNSLSLWVAS